MDTKIVIWALSNGYTAEDFATTEGKNTVLAEYKAAHGKGRKNPKTCEVFVSLPGEGAPVALGEMSNRRKTIQGAVLAWLVANNQGFDKEDLLATKITKRVVVVEEETFSALSES